MCGELLAGGMGVLSRDPPECTPKYQTIWTGLEEKLEFDFNQSLVYEDH